MTQTINYLLPAGKIKAQEVIERLKELNIEAKIDFSYEDYGAGIISEMILVKHPKLNFFYQPLTPRELRNLRESGVCDIDKIIKSVQA